MPLAATTATAEAHARLIHRLGGEAWVVPVPASAPNPALEVGRLGALPCWSIEASVRDASETARMLARRGQLGLLAADDPARGVRVLAITIAPIRVLVAAIADDHALGIRRLAALRLEEQPLLAAAARAADALDADAAGRRAFALLHPALARIVAALPGRIPVTERHAWALLQATRLLFLRFVEAEGWLDGRSDFLRQAVDGVLAGRRDPGRHLLQPLFFGTLNRRPAARSRLARSFGVIPFLNGGLFEPHPIERGRRWQLPREEWAHLFTLIVDNIEVTLDPGRLDGRVTPELLGRVFEGVMDPVDRRDSGAFYTPPDLVRAVVREALACHLAPRLGQSESALADALDDPDPDLKRILLDLRVLDPAVGSGAFLVGALDLLHGPGSRDPRRVRHLVTRRLHGIDRHPGAVRLTELRLWLEALRAMRGRRPGAVAPLPNLDASIRAGDSLLDPLHGYPLAPRAGLALAACRRAVVTSHGSAKRSAWRALCEAERRTLLAALDERDSVLAFQRRELVASQETETLFGERASPPLTVRRQLARLAAAHAAVRRERRALASGTAAAPFALEAAYAPVLALHGGFDLVVGNPPWVRAERLDAATRAALGARYRWWRGNGPGFRHLPDLAVAFLERGMEVLSPNGTMACLVPNKLLTADYARAARQAIARDHTVHCVADLGDDPRAGFEATTYPMLLIASRTGASPGHRVRCGMTSDSATIPQSTWQEAPSWSVADPLVQTLARRLARQFPPLGSTHSPHLGVKTGANAVFLNPPDSLQEYTRGAVRGRDIRADSVATANRLLWPADRRGRPWQVIPPPIERYLAPHRARLEARSDSIDHRWWRLFRTEPATADHRVVWPDLARDLLATANVPADAVPLNSCYVIVAGTDRDARLLASWLRTPWIRALARLGSEEASGGHRRFGARTVATIPLPTEVLGGEWLTAADQDDAAADLLALTRNEKRALGELAQSRS